MPLPMFTYTKMMRRATETSSKEEVEGEIDYTIPCSFWMFIVQNSVSEDAK